VYSLAEKKPFDASIWPVATGCCGRRDAEYGSATFIGATAPGGARTRCAFPTTGLSW